MNWSGSGYEPGKVWVGAWRGLGMSLERSGYELEWAWV